MATGRARSHKHFRLDPVKIKRAQKVLGAGTEAEAIERALGLMISEHKRNRLAVEANELLRDQWNRRQGRVRHSGGLDAASPDCLDSGGLQATVASDERQAKVDGSCADDAVGHVRNNISRYVPQSRSNVGVERDNLERRILLVQFTHEPAECIGGNTSTLNQGNNLNKRNS